MLKEYTFFKSKLQFFDMPCNYALNFKGKKQVAIKTTGYEKL
jgi:hypothetical protein